MDEHDAKSEPGDAMTSPAKPKRPAPPSRKGRGPTPSSWKPGQSGNPFGRPRHGLAFAERVRERVSPDLVIDLAMRVAEDEKLTPTERLAALWPLIDRGFVKPPAHLVASVESGPARDFSHLSDEQIEQLLGQLEAAAADPRSHDAPVAVDELP